jgi:hypothetical protein
MGQCLFRCYLIRKVFFKVCNVRVPLLCLPKKLFVCLFWPKMSFVKLFILKLLMFFLFLVQLYLLCKISKVEHIILLLNFLVVLSNYILLFFLPYELFFFKLSLFLQILTLLFKPRLSLFRGSLHVFGKCAPLVLIMVINFKWTKRPHECWVSAHMVLDLFSLKSESNE